MNLDRHMQAFITAIQFLTRVPVPGGMNTPDPDKSLMRLAVLYFPVVGALIGYFTGCVIQTSLYFWSAFTAVTLGLIAEAFLTGAFHEDAVADSCDAFGGGWTKEDVLRIMKDSRIGSYGTLGLLLAVLTRLSCLITLSTHVTSFGLFAALVGSAAIGRWSTHLITYLTPPLDQRDGLSKDIGNHLSIAEFGYGTLLTFVACLGSLWIFPLQSLWGFVVVIAGTLVWNWYINKRIGGVTGDCLGAGVYLAQCLFLLCLTAGYPS
ncbi:adenosylcobinamide-GDP ribazoletransferase [Planctomicrobium sp. SH668]|uniref:adenosylcobinamide-GDP ribazoletransferase n=1 Tax=Planctomicrobium sp. SH668 TaxID=3448126 RepID=UPI003F5B0524